MSRAAQAIAAMVAERKVKPREMRSRRMNDEDVRIEPTEQEQAAEAPTTGAEPETTVAGAGDKDMKRTTKKAAGRKTKKAKKAKASKVIVAKTARAAKPRKAPANGRAARLTADTVFSFVTTDGAAEEGRERAVLNAIKKIESGTAAQVGKAISSKDYKERDGAKWPASHPNVAGRILRDYLKIGNVRVVPAAN